MGRFAVWWRRLWRGWPVEVTSSLSVEAAEAALCGALARRGTWFIEDPTGRLGPRVVAGRVSEGGEIRMIASWTSGQHPWRRTLRARLLAVPDGCVVSGVLLPNALGQGFIIFSLAVSGLLAGIGVVAAVWDACGGCS